MVSIKKIFKIFAATFWVSISFPVFLCTGFTPEVGYDNMRKLFILTNGRFNDIISFLISIFKPQYSLKSCNGIIGNPEKSQVQEIAQKIEQQGFYIFDKGLNASDCKLLVDFSKSIPATLIPKITGIESKVLYESTSPLSVRYDLDEQSILGNQVVQKLATDLSLIAIAQAYLRCPPILDLVAMWWSTSSATCANSEAAQLYHFDMDRIKFIKFFVYLTPVNPNTGPHCYVKGSHHRKPVKLLREGRLSDQEIEKHYSSNELIEIAGEAGTVIAVDTRGFHKGKQLRDGERLILQIEFTNSLFGAPYNKISLDKYFDNSFINKIQDFKATYTRFSA